MTYPAVTTSGLALPAVEALEVLTLRPRSVGGVAPAVEPAMFAATAAVTARFEGAELQAVTRGGELVVELDAAVGSPLGPLTEAVATPAAGGATPTPTPAAASPAAEPAPQATPSPAPAAPSTVLLAVRSFGPRLQREPALEPGRDRAADRRRRRRRRWRRRRPRPASSSSGRRGRRRLLPRPWRRPSATTCCGGGLARGPSSIASLGSAPIVSTTSTRPRSTASSYQYTVRAVAARDPLVESGDGPVRDLEYRDTFAPPAPSGLVALAEEGRIRLLWDRVEAPDLAGYRLYRQESGGTEVELPRDPGAGTDHSDDQVRAGVSYSYRVTAVDHEENESAKSEPATADTSIAFDDQRSSKCRAAATTSSRWSSRTRRRLEAPSAPGAAAASRSAPTACSRCAACASGRSRCATGTPTGARRRSVSTAPAARRSSPSISAGRASG